MQQGNRLNIIRLNGGKPIIEADPNGWDNRFTLNPTAIYLERSKKNDPLICGLLNNANLDDPKLRNGVVAIYYRGIPKDTPGLPPCRSSVGLAVFTPELRLLKRYSHPVLAASGDPGSFDYNGVEDQRITRIGDVFYLVYCGFVQSAYRKSIQVCIAESHDLVHWRKLGPVEGDVNRWPNKDAVLLSEPVHGHYIMLHRPMVGRQSDFSISLAISDSPTGRWKDCGTVMGAVPHPRYAQSWVGMGSTPIALDEDRFLADYHTGNYLPSGERDYFANYAVLDFRKFDLKRPGGIVDCRSEAVLFPETQYELNSPWPHAKRLNCVFPCGSYEFAGDIYTIYGGADAYVLAAKVNKRELIRHTEFTRCCDGRHTWECPSLQSGFSRS